jgi:hypothetical protein
VVGGAMRWLGAGAMAAAVVVTAVPPASAAGRQPPQSPATTGWQAQTAPVKGLDPAAGAEFGQGTSPSVVSCPAAGWCVSAGGYWTKTNDLYGLIETLSDGSWSARTAPTAGLNPAPSASPGGLPGLSCPEVGSCVAVGTYNDQAGKTDGQIDTLADGVWTAQTAPAASGTTQVHLSSVSCPAPGSCVAVGYDDNAADQLEGLIETLADGTWTATALPVGQLSPAPGTTLVLSSVSCPATGSCGAAGWYAPADAGERYGVLATLADGTWTAATAPLAGLNPPSKANPGVLLEHMACPRAGMCVAAGEYALATGMTAGLTETLSDGTWTPGAVPGAFAGLTSLACPAAGACVAFGNQYIARLAGGSWQISTLPVTGLHPAASSEYSVDGLSCPAAGSCEAFGRYTDVSDLEHGFLAKLTAQGWTARTAPIHGLKPFPDPTANPLQPPYQQSIDPGQIACPTVGTCVATGYYEDNAHANNGLIETEG